MDSGYWQSTTANSGYAQLMVPLSQAAAVFDSCRITITGGDILGGCGIIAASTQFKVDHFDLSYSTASGCIDSSQICTTCVCPLIAAPVCGCNGITYINYCYAHNAGITSYTNGACNVTGVEEYPNAPIALRLFPVPAKNVLNLEYSLPYSGHTEIRVFNLLGQTLFLQRISKPSEPQWLEIGLENFAPGVYLLELKCGDMKAVKKFVIE